MPKILCVTGYRIDRPESGASVRALNIFRLLARIGEVRVVLASRFEAHLSDLNSECDGFEVIDVVRFRSTGRVPLGDRLRYEFDGRFLNTGAEQAVAEDTGRLRALMAGHDMVWVHGLKQANGFGLWHWPRSVLDIDDIQSSVERTAATMTANLFQKLRRHRQVAMWRRRERHLAERFNSICVCSTPDREELGRILGGTDCVHVLPNGFSRPKLPSERRLVLPARIGFVGSFHHPPNRAGLNWFISHVWPVIQRRMPGVRLRVVGVGGETEPWKVLENVDVLGWIADVESEMATWALTVVPIFFGGGTRIKTAEAFSRKCPVVSTTLGVYGYEVVDGREVLVADSTEDFASKCLRLMADPALGAAIAEMAWEKFLKQWTWDSYADRVSGIVNRVLQANDAPYNQAIFSN